MSAKDSSPLYLHILTGLALLVFIKFAKPLLVPLVLAFILTLILAQPVHYLMERWRMPVQAAASLVLSAVFGTLVVFAIVMLPPAKEWLAATLHDIHSLGDLLERLRATLPWLAPASTRQLRENLTVQSLDITGTVLAHGSVLLLGAVATVILTFLLLISERWLFAKILTLLPDKRHRARLLGSLREAQREVNHFFRTMSLINLGMGIVTALAMSALGLPNAPFWGALVAVLNFIPYFGPMLLMLLFLLAGVSLFDTPAMMFAPLLAFIVINMVESNIASPWIIGRRLRLNPLAIFFSVLLLGWLWGIAGAFLTLPLLIVVRCIASRQRNKVLFHFVGRCDDTPSTFSAWLKSPRAKALKHLKTKA